jgi:hypothetical protein
MSIDHSSADQPSVDLPSVDPSFRPAASPGVYSWWRFLYNHNPFYVVSALLTLYGLHVSFADGLDPTQGWLLMRLLAGYALLLAAAAILIVRYGKVWEDARTLVLLVALLTIAMSASFDRVCLDNVRLGASFLLAGFIFSIALCELIIRGLQVRLPWSYRGPCYAAMAILFAYPPYLGHLSLDDQERKMAWLVLALPTLLAVTALMLVPAIRRRGTDLRRNGTPWPWPWYPMSWFVILAIGGVLRAFSLGISFEKEKGFSSGLQLYAFIPLALAATLLWVEGSRRRNPWRSVIGVGLPLAMLLFALSGYDATAAQTYYRSLLQSTVGSPLQLAGWLTVVYFSYLWFRRVAGAEGGLLITLAVLSWAGPNTMSLDTLAPLQPIPAAIVGLLLLGRGLWLQSSFRFALLAGYVTLGASILLHGTVFTVANGYLPWHMFALAFLSLGLLYRDDFAKWIADVSPGLLVLFAATALVLNRYLFPTATPAVNALLALVLAAIAALYWRRKRHTANLVALAACLISSTTSALEQILLHSDALMLLKGKRWLALGVGCFAAGLLISLIKGGQVQRLIVWLKSFDVREEDVEQSG